MEKQLELWDFPVNPERLMGPDEIFERANEVLIKKLVENRRIERKPGNVGPDFLGEYFSMWANTSPDGGVIAVGVNDDGDIEGCQGLSQQRINDLEKTGHNFCPDAKMFSKLLPVRKPDGMADSVLLFRVLYHPSVVVRTNKGEAFIRRGDSKCRLKDDEIRELQIDKGEVNFEMQDCRLVYPGDFDYAAITQFTEKVRTSRELSSALTNEEILEVRRLGRIDSGLFIPSNAMVLLFGDDPIRKFPGCKIHFQRFEGVREETGSKYNAVKDIILEGTVPSLIQQAERLLDSQLRTFSPLDKKGKFFPVPEYPKEAWYEAVVNACVHRSYGNGMKNMPIFVKMFDDHLIVENPGPFPPTVTPENIYDSHHARNPHMMDAMFYLQYVKCAHEGTRRMRDRMADMGLPAPDFRTVQQGATSVRVTLKNNINQRRAWIDKDLTRIVNEAVAASLSEDERRVLNWLIENKEITVSDAGKLLDTSWQSAKKLLFELCHKSLCQYIRFRPWEKDVRDQRAYFRIKSTASLPEGAFDAINQLADEPVDGV